MLKDRLMSFFVGFSERKIENRTDKIESHQQNDNPEQSGSVFVFYVRQEMNKSIL